MAAMDIVTTTSGATMTDTRTQGIKIVLHPVTDLAADTTAGLPACVAKQVTRPVRNREARVESRI